MPKDKGHNDCLPVHFAFLSEASLDIVTLLVKASVKVTGDNGRLPPHYAISRQQPVEMLTFLIEPYPESVKVEVQAER